MAAQKGFTLVELLVVISIIAILSVIGITVFSGVQKSTRDARRKADLHAISLALEQYKVKNGTYPQTGGGSFNSDSGSDPWITGLDSSYMTIVPRDPKNTGGGPYAGGYTYNYTSGDHYGATGGSYFILVAHLENPNSADKKTQCTFPNSTTSYGSTNSNANNTFSDTYFVCNQL